jgi:cytidine deaminase
MKREITKIVGAEIIGFKSLNSKDQELLSRAAVVRNNSQAPYSKYHVGVALLSGAGTIHVGCNVERCTFTQTTHAEQNAIDNMIAQLGSEKIEAVAVVGAPKGIEIECPPDKIEELVTSFDDVAMPCGHCLQIIWENCHNDQGVKIISMARSGEVVCTTIGDLLPMRFGPVHFGVDYSAKHDVEKRSEST